MSLNYHIYDPKKVMEEEKRAQEEAEKKRQEEERRAQEEVEKRK